MAFETLTPEATRDRTSEGDWIFLDVRTVEEFEQGHIPGAWNIPFAFRDPAEGMVMNEEFALAVKRHFTFESQLVLC